MEIGIPSAPQVTIRSGKVYLRISPSAVLSQKSHLIIVTPSPLQIPQAQDKWQRFADQVDVVSASPYGDMDEITAAAEKAAELDGDIIVLDCIGFSLKMKRVFTSITGKSVILPRTLLARIVRELL